MAQLEQFVQFKLLNRNLERIIGLSDGKPMLLMTDDPITKWDLAILILSRVRL